MPPAKRVATQQLRSQLEACESRLVAARSDLDEEKRYLREEQQQVEATLKAALAARRAKLEVELSVINDELDEKLSQYQSSRGSSTRRRSPSKQRYRRTGSDAINGGVFSRPPPQRTKRDYTPFGKKHYEQAALKIGCPGSGTGEIHGGLPWEAGPSSERKWRIEKLRRPPSSGLAAPVDHVQLGKLVCSSLRMKDTSRAPLAPDPCSVYAVQRRQNKKGQHAAGELGRYVNHCLKQGVNPFKRGGLSPQKH